MSDEVEGPVVGADDAVHDGEAGAVTQAWDRVHPRLTHRASWLDHGGKLPLIEGTLIRLEVEHLSKDRAASAVWLWSSKTGAWSAFLLSFDLEHTFRMLKQNKVRAPATTWAKPSDARRPSTSPNGWRVEEQAETQGVQPGRGRVVAPETVPGHLTKHSLDQLTALVKTRLKRMQYRPGLIEGLTAKAGLDLQPPEAR